jgi:hypothetical protein
MTEDLHYIIEYVNFNTSGHLSQPNTNVQQLSKLLEKHKKQVMKDGSTVITPKKLSSQWKYPPRTDYEKNVNCAGEGNQYQMHHSVTRD